ncbi:MAG: amino acid ABC transporter substrate-binding protein [Gammaproteobacteria bacterium]|nr:MAG: amino acid ABC transporter substrate-binding protein [Gammaproteobacteria bacterium]
MRFWRVFLGGLVALCLPLHAGAAGTLDKIKLSKTINLGYREASMPFSYVGDDNQPWGYSVDLCTKVAAAIVRQLGLEELQLQWVSVTPETRVGKLKSGAIDLDCGSTTATLSRMEEVDFSLVTYVDGGGYVTRRGSGVKTFADLSGRTVAVAAGTTSERTLNEALKQRKLVVQLTRVSEHQQGVSALLQGKADAYVSDRSLLIGLMLDAGAQGEWVLGPEILSVEPYALMMRRNDADFRLAVNRELARLSRSREIHVIYDRWFGFLGKPAPLLDSVYQLNNLPE